MTKKTLSLAILFAEICQSDSFFKVLSNQDAKKLVNSYIDILSEQTAKHNGTVIKTIGGNKIMSTFPDAVMVVEAACAMQQAIDQMPDIDEPGLPQPAISVGVHFGEAIWEDNDVFGDAVNVAARMLSLAKPRQIVTIEETIEALPQSYQSMTRYFDRTTIKGKTGEHNIYEIVWEQQELTAERTTPVSDLMLDTRLKIQFHDNIIIVDKNRPSISLGRHASNDIVVNDVHVSRNHAYVEYNRGKFVLIDQSSNGTYLNIHGRDVVCLRREKAPLLGSGHMGLGLDVEPDSQLAVQISFQI